jgi:hypothetical protein
MRKQTHISHLIHFFSLRKREPSNLFIVGERFPILYPEQFRIILLKKKTVFVFFPETIFLKIMFSSAVSKLLSKHHELLDDHIKKVQNIKYKEKKELIKIGIFTERDIKNIKKKMKDLNNQNIKKCEPSQVRNPNTLRCVKRDGKLGKKLVHSQDLD